MLIKKLNGNGKEAAGNVAAGLIVMVGQFAWVNHDPFAGWGWHALIGSCFFCLFGVFACVLTGWGVKWQRGGFTVVNLLIAFLGAILGGLGWGL